MPIPGVHRYIDGETVEFPDRNITIKAIAQTTGQPISKPATAFKKQSILQDINDDVMKELGPVMGDDPMVKVDLAAGESIHKRTHAFSCTCATRKDALTLGDWLPGASPLCSLAPSAPCCWYKQAADSASPLLRTCVRFHRCHQDPETDHV